MNNNLIITISRQYGTGGREIGQKLALRLGIPFYDRELITRAAKKTGFDEKLFDQLDKRATNSFLYSLTMDGTEHKVGSLSEFRQLMSQTSPGQMITVGTLSAVAEGDIPEVEYTELTLTDNGGIGFLGITVSTGGMTFTTPGILLDRAVNPFYGADSAYGYLTSFLGYLSGPFNGMDPISEDVQWWYDAPMGQLFWIVITLLYWLFWLNILLAISNALPAYPFDGGFIFAGGVSWLCERLGVRDEERRQRITDSVSNSVSTVVLFMFMIVILSFVM